MKAVRYYTYGGPDVLRLEDVKIPSPGDDQVLIKVHAASVNPLDWHFMRGTPYAMRAQSGLRAPREPRLGVDVAGVVEAAGPRVAQFRNGDEVFGTARGSFAEYATATERTLVRKPDGVTFEEAAAAGVAAVTAIQALRDKGRVRAGDEVLINGASGGVGTFALQMAHVFGGRVTAVCSTKNLALVRSLGADEAIDYTQVDFTAGERRFDVIVDMIGGQSLRACRRVMTPDGRYVIVGGPSGKWMAPFDRALRAAVLSPFISQDMGLAMVRASRDDFEAIGGLLGAGRIRSVIDRRYPLSDVPAAIRYVEEGHARGKVIISVAEPPIH